MLGTGEIKNAAADKLHSILNDLGVTTGLATKEELTKWKNWAMYERNTKDNSCWRYYDRGVGTIPSKCYDPDHPAYNWPQCYAVCPSGYAEVGCCLCQFTGTRAYARIVMTGFFQFHDHGSCRAGYTDIAGICWYTHVPKGLHGSAHDPMRNSKGASCDRSSNRKDMQGGLCYMDPGHGDKGYGDGQWDCAVTMCRSRAPCASPSVACGTSDFPRCAPDHATCTSDVVGMVFAPIMVVVNIVSTVCSFGTATAKSLLRGRAARDGLG